MRVVLNYSGDKSLNGTRARFQWRTCVSTLCWRLHFVSCRQLKQNKKNDELLEQYNCEIQEFKLKQRKQRYLVKHHWCANESINVKECEWWKVITTNFCRIKFENQLHQLMEQHKILNSMFVCYFNIKWLTQFVTCLKIINGQVCNIHFKIIF